MGHGVKLKLIPWTAMSFLENMVWLSLDFNAKVVSWCVTYVLLGSYLYCMLNIKKYVWPRQGYYWCIENQAAAGYMVCCGVYAWAWRLFPTWASSWAGSEQFGSKLVVQHQWLPAWGDKSGSLTSLHETETELVILFPTHLSVTLGWVLGEGQGWCMGSCGGWRKPNVNFIIQSLLCFIISRCLE